MNGTGSRHSVAAALAAALLLATPPDALAQSAPSGRDGFWYGLGAGAGWDRLACDICAGDRLSGVSGYLQAGGTLRPDWRLGGEVKFWNRGHEGVDYLAGAFSVVAIWHPNPARPLHLKGGVGYMALHADDGEDTLGTSSFGPQIGIGTEIALAPGVSLTPYASWMITPFGDLTFNDTRVRGGVRSTLLQVGLGVTGH